MVLVPVPDRGRVFSARRLVRLGDVSPAGRLRLDAVARYLQDVSSDDTTDADLADDMAWVVRRTVIAVERPAVFREELTMRTFCSGVGSRWAERRVSIAGGRGARIEAVALWVFVDASSGRPARLPAQFHDLYGAAAAGRQVRARLSHGKPPPAALAGALPWPLRFVDFDVLGHVNNAAYWAAVEEAVAARPAPRGALTASLEFGAGVERDHRVEMVTVDDDDGFALWLVDATTGAVAASAVVRRGARPDGQSGSE